MLVREAVVVWRVCTVNENDVSMPVDVVVASLLLSSGSIECANEKALMPTRASVQIEVECIVRKNRRNPDVGNGRTDTF